MAHQHITRDEAPIKPGRDAEGVTYTTTEAAPGLKMFRCEVYRATMATTGCANRWREAQRVANARRGAGRGQARAPMSKEVASRTEACRSCPIGAAHAGEDTATYSWMYGTEICPRCRKGTTRMIGGRVCIGCYNRQREVAAGKNARGNAPVELLQRAPKPRRYRLTHGGYTRRTEELGVDLFEPVMQTLRTAKGGVIFSFTGYEGGIRQGRLF